MYDSGFLFLGNIKKERQLAFLGAFVVALEDIVFLLFESVLYVDR